MFSGVSILFFVLQPDDAEPKPKRPRGRPKGTFKKPRPTVQKENALLKVDILLDFKAF